MAINSISVPNSAPVDLWMSHKSDSNRVLFREYHLVEPGGRLRLRPSFDATDPPDWSTGVAPEMLLAESLRQAVILYAHISHGVLADDSFVMERMLFEVLSLPPLERADVVLTTRASEVRGAKLVTLVAEFQFVVDSETCVRGEGHLRVIPKAIFQRFRRDKRRSSELSQSGVIESGFSAHTLQGAGTLLYDPRHPLYFDHEVDHVPGMLLVAAAIADFKEIRPNVRVGTVDARFYQFLDLEPSCTVTMVSNHNRSGLRGEALSATFSGNDGIAAEVMISSN